MKKKFVQIASFTLMIVLSLALTAPAAFASSGGDAGLGTRLMRIGIYYGSSGKQSVELKLTTGDGFRFGTFNDEGSFVPAEGVEPAEVKSMTVKADSSNTFGFAVYNTATGELIYRFDDKGLGTGLAILPYSASGKKTVTKCGYAYYGSFRFERFTSNNDLMTIVNYVQLDDYVKGVVPYEVSASWPMEALKAQAVCARTYALTRVDASHQNGYHFDLCDSTHCQEYRGVYTGSYAEESDEAVESTSGVTIKYNGEYCLAVYAASNGGASESSVNVYGTNYPYLVGKLDPYEPLVADSISGYEWTASFTGAELQDKLIASGSFSGCGLITGVQTTLSGTGNVIGLTFWDVNGKSYSVTGSKCRTLLGLRSMRYTVSGTGGTASVSGSSSGLMDTNGRALDFSQGLLVIDGTGTVTTATGGYILTAEGVQEIDASGGVSEGSSVAYGESFTFSGTGWGHNLGLSQWGAYAMARQGYTYKQILEFYYTGVTVE